LDPLALLQLRESGQCFVSVPEALFDLDYPGHYLRRLKSISVSIPCVTGPYTSVNCTLTLLRSSVRFGNTLSNGTYARDEQNDDGRFVDIFGAVQSIVTSTGQNDGGLFEPNLRDERYLPFEGAGVISEWHLEMPNDFRTFDYDTISDVILHIRYTAREGGGQLRQQATEELRVALNALRHSTGPDGLARLFSLRHDFPNAFHRLLNPSAGEEQETEFGLTRQHFPYFLTGHDLELSAMNVYLEPADGAEIETAGLVLTINGIEVSPGWSQVPGTTLIQSTVSVSGSPFTNWSLNAGTNGFARDVLEDIWIWIGFEIQETPQ
jgi:hypothetical protein